MPGLRAGGQLINPHDAAPVIPDRGADLARLSRLRHSYLHLEVLAGPDIPIPVVRTASILFTDIRGFSRLTERFGDDPAGLLDILNSHLKRVIRSITICGGVIEKFVGDGAMATFGATEEQPDHTHPAIAPAIALVSPQPPFN